MAYVYRYTDLADGIIKYVRIVFTDSYKLSVVSHETLQNLYLQ